jgi:hypothetical protein
LRQQLSFIAEFLPEINYIACGDNLVADTLSRLPTTPCTRCAACRGGGYGSSNAVANGGFDRGVK